ncbi:MAG: hypothetical protein ACOYED_07905 [Peptococcia bacterium]
MKKRDIINQEFPTEDDFNKINDLLNEYLNGEYAFVKTPDGYRIIRKKSLNERMDEINRDNSIVEEKVRIKGKSKEEKIL